MPSAVLKWPQCSPCQVFLFHPSSFFFKLWTRCPTWHVKDTKNRSVSLNSCYGRLLQEDAVHCLIEYYWGTALKVTYGVVKWWEFGYSFMFLGDLGLWHSYRWFVLFYFILLFIFFTMPPEACPNIFGGVSCTPSQCMNQNGLFWGQF